MTQYIKNVAMTGAGGRVGGHIAKALLATGKHTVTGITRPGSTSNFAQGIIVKTADYDDQKSLVEILKGQDAFIITLAGLIPEDKERKLIEAAAEAGVPWVLPNEFGSDQAHPAINEILVNKRKNQYRELVENLGKSSWIGVINNQWYDWSLQQGGYGIDVPNRTAKFYDDGEVKVTTTALPQVGRAVAALLSLPVNGASPCVSDWQNQFFYIKSFSLSQRDMLSSVERVTGTSDSDWKIENINTEEAIKKGYEEIQKGNFWGLRDVLYGTTFLPGKGGDYATTKGTANGILGLPQEDLDEVTRGVVEEIESK